MKIVHIYQKSSSIFMEPYIQFIKEAYSLTDHYFIAWNKGSDGCNKINENFFTTESMNAKEVKMLLRMADKIILHSLSIPQATLYLSLHPHFLKKTYWISWGGDIIPFTEQRKGLKANLYEGMRRYVIKRFAGIGTLVNEDFTKICKTYTVRGKHYKAIYLNQLLVNESKLYFNVNAKCTKEKYILLGNSATESNRHIEALELLERFKNDPIKVICPLSYGDREYGEFVIKRGKELLGDKFCPLEDLLDEKSYYHLLGTVDAGIFNNDRQQALGNIYALLIQGKKLYLRRGTSMWDELVEEDKVKIYNVECLKNIGFSELDKMPDETRKRNSEVIIYKNSPENSKKIWDLIFEE